MFTIEMNNLLELKPLSNRTQIMNTNEQWGTAISNHSLVEEFSEIACRQFNLYTTMNINQSTYCFHKSKQIQM